MTDAIDGLFEKLPETAASGGNDAAGEQQNVPAAAGDKAAIVKVDASASDVTAKK